MPRSLVPHTGRTLEILLVEDNEQDALLTREGLDEADVEVNVHHVENGDQCLAFLRRLGHFSIAPTPDLILLDLNMPVMDGREVLREIVADDGLRHLPVIILTTSTDEADVLEAYRLRCSSYIRKPVDYDLFSSALKELVDYWFSVVVRPPRATTSHNGA